MEPLNWNHEGNDRPTVPICAVCGVAMSRAQQMCKPCYKAYDHDLYRQAALKISMQVEPIPGHNRRLIYVSAL